MMQASIYTPLPPKSSERRATAYTRVLQLSPGVGADPLYGVLDTIDIANAPYHFEALSYVWGTENSGNPLLIGDHRHQASGHLEITKNLEQALRNLRLPNLVRRLWVDAVCINQKDSSECGRQVTYMRLIYKHATRVVVWLGVKDESVRRAFAFAQELAMHTARPSQGIPNSQVLPQMVLHMEAFDHRPDDAQALAALLSRAYFERVWCVQEVTAASTCIAKSEDLEMDFDLLLAPVPAILQWRGIFNGFGLNTWGLVSGQKLLAHKLSRVEGSLGAMLTILTMNRNFKATNPRDRIYALLGCTDEGLDPLLPVKSALAKEKAPLRSVLQKGIIWLAEKTNSFAPPGGDIVRHSSLKPNYEKSVCHVYRDFTRYCIGRQPGLLDVLSHVQHYSVPGADEFPSWVPKFYEPRLCAFFLPAFSIAGIPAGVRYAAQIRDNSLDQENRTGFGGIAEPNILQAAGFRVDVVEVVSETITERLHENSAVEELWSQLFATPLFPRVQQHYGFSTESVDIAFLMTLICGNLMPFVKIFDQMDPASFAQEIEDQMLDQAKNNIYSWLKERPGVNIHDYPELSQDSRDTGHGEGVSTVHPEGVSTFEGACYTFSFNRKVYRTKSGILGIGPKVMEAGDHVIVLFGGRYPFVMRQTGSDWMFLGDTYIRHDDVMRGRVATVVKSGKAPQRIERFRIR